MSDVEYDHAADAWMKSNGHDWGESVLSRGDWAKVQAAEFSFGEDADPADDEDTGHRYTPRGLTIRDLGYQRRMRERAVVVPKCEGCGSHFEGRMDAKTCSPRCRKRVSRRK